MIGGCAEAAPNNSSCTSGHPLSIVWATHRAGLRASLKHASCGSAWLETSAEALTACRPHHRQRLCRRPVPNALHAHLWHRQGRLRAACQVPCAAACQERHQDWGCLPGVHQHSLGDPPVPGPDLFGIGVCAITITHPCMGGCCQMQQRLCLRLPVEGTGPRLLAQPSCALRTTMQPGWLFSSLALATALGQRSPYLSLPARSSQA